MVNRFALVLCAIGIHGCGADADVKESQRQTLEQVQSSQVRIEKALSDARAACAQIIERETGGDAHWTAPENSGQPPSEFYFAWPAGRIKGGRREKPDLLTGSMEPSAMCIGSIDSRQITDLTANGRDVIPPNEPVTF